MLNNNPSLLTAAKIWALFPAAGHGSRFGSKTPKQYQPFMGRTTLLQYTVDKVCQVLPIAHAVIVHPPGSSHPELSFDTTTPLHWCAGGAERMLSVYAGLNYVTQLGATNDDWVLIHDVARPCVAKEDLLALFQCAHTHDTSCTLATPISDTLKKCSTSDNFITHEMDRDNLWAMQTPQISKIAWLKQALDFAIANHRLHTDESSALQSIGLPVKVVSGNRSNFKITYASDWALAELVCQGQNPPT